MATTPPDEPTRNRWTGLVGKNVVPTSVQDHLLYPVNFRLTHHLRRGGTLPSAGRTVWAWEPATVASLRAWLKTDDLNGLAQLLEATKPGRPTRGDWPSNGRRGERSVAPRTRSPPIRWGDTSIPGDRTHPGVVLGDAPDVVDALVLWP